LYYSVAYDVVFDCIVL